MAANKDVFSGVAEFYDRCRPSPPDVLPALLCRLASADRPALVVDLGCGTGLSTLPWAGKAHAVIGIDPNQDMLSVASGKAAAWPTVSFRQADANKTGLPDACADIITCAQSFHWMEPAATLAEINRILRPGGVFAAYDYLWPPKVNGQAEQAYESFIARAWERIEQRGLTQDFHQWEENRRLPVLRNCGYFRTVNELWLQRQETGSAQRFCDLALSNGVIQALERGKIHAAEIGVGRFRHSVQATMGESEVSWLLTYHVRIGFK